MSDPGAGAAAGADTEPFPCSLILRTSSRRKMKGKPGERRWRSNHKRGYRGGCGWRVSLTEEGPGPGRGMMSARAQWSFFTWCRNRDRWNVANWCPNTLLIQLQRNQTAESCAELRGNTLHGPRVAWSSCHRTGNDRQSTAVVNSICGIRARERPLTEPPLRRGCLSGNGRCLRSRPAPRDAAIKTIWNIWHAVWQLMSAAHVNAQRPRSIPHFT